MIKHVQLLTRVAICTLPFLALLWLSAKANLKKKERSKQFLMPIITLVASVLVILFLRQVNEWLVFLLNLIPDLIAKLSDFIAGLLDGKLMFLAEALEKLQAWLREALANLDITYWIFVISNIGLLLLFVLAKRIVTLFLKLNKPGNALYDKLVSFFYTFDEENNVYYVKERLAHARSLIKTAYYAAVAFSLVCFCTAAVLFREQILQAPFYPVFGIVILGEVYFFLDGITKDEDKSSLEGESDENTKIVDYRQLEDYQRKLFGDKLSIGESQTNYGLSSISTNDEILEKMEESQDSVEAAYGVYMRNLARSGFELDQNLLVSGLDLVQGKSVLFNDPFYPDMIPYAFYAINRTVLKSKRVLVVLGRHGIEDEVVTWCQKGIQRLTGVDTIWNVGVLGRTEDKQALDIGILTRSEVNDIQLHAANEDFFDDVEFVVILEPSRLITTAQIGLNSIVKRCNRNPNKQMVFCSADKNCDGLLDALSHILMTRITAVSPSKYFSGVSTCMVWDATGEHLLHRMIPNVARYLGMGTELAFTAIRNQVSKAAWYGGEAFPVADMKWISSQYYHELLGYAGLPENQHMFDSCFETSPNPWNPAKAENAYLIVEDEASNMFEVMRNYATRASEQSFVNIISPEYLLKDYMAENAGIFRADAKAIPYIVADYARTRRNVVMRTLLLMCTDTITHQELAKELMLVGINEADPLAAFWQELCLYNSPGGVIERSRSGEIMLTRTVKGVKRSYSMAVIQSKRKYNFATAEMETHYFIRQENFIQSFVVDLQNAGYLAEDEKGGRYFLGTELRGHIFQRFLPGQFFTFAGRYYEMQDVTGDGHVLIRRAADHIHTRQWYRQVRNYHLENITDIEEVGSRKNISGMGITRQYADVVVDTPAYWRMETFNDFEKGKLVALNGIPQRHYYRKSVLKLDLPEAPDSVIATVAMLMNEIFVTLFAENQPYITALTSLTKDIRQVPCTMDGADPRSIYIVEDSVLDMGLLVAVERNLERILFMVCDYLDWHQGKVNPEEPAPAEEPTQEPEPTEDTAETQEEPKKKGKLRRFFGRIWDKIRGIFRKKKKPEEAAEAAEGEQPVEGAAEKPAKKPNVFARAGRAIKNFFGKLFGKKKPKDQEPEEDGTDVPESEDVPSQEPQPTEEVTPEPEEEASSLETEDFPEEPVKDGLEEEEAMEEEPLEVSDEVPEGVSEATDEADPMPLASIGSNYKQLYASIQAEQGSEEAQKGNFESEFTFAKPPYEARYYLLFGSDKEPEGIAPQQTLEYLRGLGFGNGALKQARDNQDTSENIASLFEPGKKGARYCDFCGAEILGAEYEVLKDGRERCNTCSRTAIKDEAQFEKLYKKVIADLNTFYGASINVPIDVHMVNAKTLHKKLGKSFVPTGNSDGRVLGVAILDKRKKTYSIYLENGSPRMMAAMTMAHELTHIWQYTNWNDKDILSTYGKENRLLIYEGMAKWAEIQYAALVGEAATAKREEILTLYRQDEYGIGFAKYREQYPIVFRGKPARTPFGEGKPLQ